MGLLSDKILKNSSSFRMLERMLRVDEARSSLLSQATDRFGAPTESQKALLEGIESHDQLVHLCRKLLTVATWDELLAPEPVS